MANENKLSDSRISEFAKSQVKKSSRYMNVGNLSLFSDLEPQPGMTFFSIAVRSNGVWDQNEYTRVLRLGLRPVLAKHYPQCQLPDGIYYPEGHGPSAEVIEIGGHMLMECPTKDAEEIRSEYTRRTRDSEAQVHAAYVDDGSSSQFGIVGHRYR